MGWSLKWLHNYKGEGPWNKGLQLADIVLKAAGVLGLSKEQD